MHCRHWPLAIGHGSSSCIVHRAQAQRERERHTHTHTQCLYSVFLCGRGQLACNQWQSHFHSHQGQCACLRSMESINRPQQPTASCECQCCIDCASWAEQYFLFLSRVLLFNVVSVDVSVDVAACIQRMGLAAGHWGTVSDSCGKSLHREQVKLHQVILQSRGKRTSMAQPALVYSWTGRFAGCDKVQHGPYNMASTLVLLYFCTSVDKCDSDQVDMQVPLQWSSLLSLLSSPTARTARPVPLVGHESSLVSPGIGTINLGSGTLCPLWDRFNTHLCIPRAKRQKAWDTHKRHLRARGTKFNRVSLSFFSSSPFILLVLSGPLASPSAPTEKKDQAELSHRWNKSLSLSLSHPG